MTLPVPAAQREAIRKYGELPSEEKERIGRVHVTHKFLLDEFFGKILIPILRDLQTRVGALEEQQPAAQPKALKPRVKFLGPWCDDVYYQANDAVVSQGQMWRSVCYQNCSRPSSQNISWKAID